MLKNRILESKLYRVSHRSIRSFVTFSSTWPLEFRCMKPRGSLPVKCRLGSISHFCYCRSAHSARYGRITLSDMMAELWWTYPTSCVGSTLNHTRSHSFVQLAMKIIRQASGSCGWGIFVKPRRMSLVVHLYTFRQLRRPFHGKKRLRE